MTRFLIHANAPTAPTGYGVQCAALADRLAEAGHEVAVSVTWGHQAGIGQWTSPSGHKVRLYPSGWHMNSVDVIHQHAMHWFDNDPRGGWIITLLDVWCLTPNPVLDEFKILAWTPVDHYPVPPAVAKFFEASGAVPVAMSKFGQTQLQRVGLEAEYVPLSVDCRVFKPTRTLTVGEHEVSCREVFGLDPDAFVVTMVAMNKDRRDRKGFGVAFQAFSEFHKRHPDTVLMMHTDKDGLADGLDLVTMARMFGIPDHAVVWSDQYAYRLGIPSEMMAALLTASDVLLAPSKGEGFGVPLIEAQACGTPVIASDYTSQSELVGGGWKVGGQVEVDPDQGYSFYLNADVLQVIDALEASYDPVESDMMQTRAMMFAPDYDTDEVWATHWLPLLDKLDPPPPESKPRLDPESLDIIVPVMRKQNRDRFWDSLAKTSSLGPDQVRIGSERFTYAENVNDLLVDSTADWVLIVGDDVEFTPGWLEAAVEASEFADVIGTNDSEPGRVRNKEVAAGKHADHFFVRRSYIDTEGACLDGPGVLAPEAYQHWFTDKEIVWLAQARNVFVFAPDCRIIHHHPGYDGDESARLADPLYVKAVARATDDEATFAERAPLIAQHKAGLR